MRDSFQVCTPNTPTNSTTKVSSVPNTFMDLHIRPEDIIPDCGVWCIHLWSLRRSTSCNADFFARLLFYLAPCNIKLAVIDANHYFCLVCSVQLVLQCRNEKLIVRAHEQCQCSFRLSSTLLVLARLCPKFLFDDCQNDSFGLEKLLFGEFTAIYNASQGIVKDRPGNPSDLNAVHS